MANEETLSYIRQHRLEDPRRLALQSHPDGVDIKYALEQIAGWQTARRKLPEWAAVDGIVFPPHLSMEQCSSQPTALYKQGVAERLLGSAAHAVVDLTGGYGVDFSYIARIFERGVYVERQSLLCDIARHNMPLLGLRNVEVVCGDGMEYLSAMNRVSMVYLDPARRDGNGGRTYGIADCTPDVLAVRSELMAKADVVMIKLSPMLDWHKAVADIGMVSEVHIVSVRNECKELLLVAGGSGSDVSLRVFCANCGSDGAWSVDEFLFDGVSRAVSPTFSSPVEGEYLFEPNASVMKFGGFGALCAKYGVCQVAPNSNLFVSADCKSSFPGRRFRVDGVSGMGKKELRRALAGISKANVAVRNFPQSVADLRKRLKLKDGGDKYVFATTLLDGSHALVVCSAAR